MVFKRTDEDAERTAPADRPSGTGSLSECVHGSLRLALGPEGGLKQAVWVLESWGRGFQKKNKEPAVCSSSSSSHNRNVQRWARRESTVSFIRSVFWFLGRGVVCLFVFQAKETLCRSDAGKQRSQQWNPNQQKQHCLFSSQIHARCQPSFPQHRFFQRFACKEKPRPLRYFFFFFFFFKVPVCSSGAKKGLTWYVRRCTSVGTR